MKREELERIRVMVEEDQVSLLELANQLPALLRHIAEQGAKIERLREAVEACLLFHDAAEWDAGKRLAWHRLTGSSEATTKVLCDTARAALKEAQGE